MSRNFLTIHARAKETVGLAGRVKTLSYTVNSCNHGMSGLVDFTPWLTLFLGCSFVPKRGGQLPVVERGTKVVDES